jgi:hypothetical protein
LISRQVSSLIAHFSSHSLLHSRAGFFFET